MTGYHERLTQLPRWRGGALVAFGSQMCHTAPRVGDLVIREATQTRPGVPRRIASVREDTRDGRRVWIIEHTPIDDEPATSARESTGFWQDVGWPRLPEHYPVCAKCHDLMPCEHSVIDTIAKQNAEKLDRFADPNVCPACREVITHRQKVIVFQTNLHGLSTVAFHTRRKCIREAREYDRQVHHQDGEYQLNCPGAFRGGLDSDGLPVSYCTEEHCRGQRMHHMRGGWWQNAYIEQPDGYHRVEDHQ